MNQIMLEALHLGVAGTAGPATFAAFIVAVVIMDALDVALPRGDSVSVAGALVAAMVALHGVPAGLLVATVAAVVSLCLRGGLAVSSWKWAARVVSLLGVLGLTLVLGDSLERLPLLRAALAVVTYLSLEFLVSQTLAGFRQSRSILGLMKGNLRRHFPLMASQLSASLLVIVTYDGMREWSILPVTALLLITRQSFALLHEIRETYRTTVEVLIQAAEQSDTRRRGHAERTALIARRIAARLHLSAKEVERVNFAALLHDIGVIAQEQADERGPQARAHSGSGAKVIEDAEFFGSVSPVLHLCEGDVDGEYTRDDVRAALIVALASDIDCLRRQVVSLVHDGNTVDRVLPAASQMQKSRVVAAAVELGYQIPAVW